MSRSFALGLCPFALAMITAACGSTSTESPTDVSDASSDGPSSAKTGDDDGGTDAPTTQSDGGPFTPAAHTPFPDVSKNSGVVLANPHLVSITFTGDANRAQVDALSAYIGTSSWLTTVGQEYGIGPGTHEEAHLPALPGTLTDAALQKVVADAIASHALPAVGSDPTKKPIYMVYIPAGVHLTETDGTDDVCGNSDAYGYHDNGTTTASDAGASETFSYAVIGDCQTGIADVTSTAAHEYIETATDPNPNDTSGDGYWMNTPLPDPWYTNYDELADLCQYEGIITVDGFALQRSWSNAAAKKNGSPCVPAVPGEIYFNTTSQPATVQTVPAGGTAVFTMTGWSTAPTAPWTITTEAGDNTDFDPTPVLSAATIDNGGTITVTLTVPSTAKSGQFGGAYVVSGDFDHRWPVGVQAQ